MSGIVISYRREDTSYIAGRLSDGLAARFGGDQIFRDIDTIRPGTDFVEQIERAVGSCDAVVVVIGDEWLSAKDASGNRRLDNPEDFVRLEIAAALARNVLVVPVLVENARMPSEAELPPPLRKLARINALELTDARWDYDMQSMVDVLEQVVTPRSTPSVPPPTQYQGGATGPWTPSPPAPTPPTGPAPVGGGRAWTTPSEPASASRLESVPGWAKVVVPLGLLAVVGVVGFLVLRPTPDSRAQRIETEIPTTSVTEPPVTTRPPGTTTTSRPVSTSAGTRVITGPWTGRNGGLTLTVEKLEATANVVRIHMVVNNSTTQTLTLPAQGFTAVDNAANNYKADPFSEDWPRSFPPGTVRGVMEVAGPLRAGATTMKVGWGTVFWNGLSNIRSIFVEGVRLS